MIRGIKLQLLAAMIGIAPLLPPATGSDIGGTDEYDYAAPLPGTYQLPVIRPGADGEVLEHHGRAMRLHDVTKRRITVLSFIYTRCAAAKACPYATGVLMRLHRFSADDPLLAKHMRLVSMSFDPENDTPERMSAYARLAERRPSASEWHFLTTASERQLKPILEAYGQAVDRKDNASDPSGPLNHNLRVILLDSAGNIRNIYSSGTLDIRLVLADVKTLIMEQENRTGTKNQ